jgi:tRNA threonylcarbamoyladenosine biosynthesis protein TsaB
LALILQIDTATPVCSAAVAADGIVLASASVNEGYKHAENIVALCLKVLHDSEKQKEQIDAIAVSCGPGSYTGLRIGVSTAKGLCYGLDVPLIAVSTLQMMAEQFYSSHPHFEGIAVPMIDARRMEVYTGMYDQTGTCVLADRAFIVNEQTLETPDKQSLFAFFGDGAAKCRDILEVAFPLSHFDLLAAPDACGLSRPAHRAFEQKQFADLAYFEPEYLKPYQGTPPTKS